MTRFEVQSGLKKAFDALQRVLLGESGAPGMTLDDLRQLVGYPARAQGDLPLWCSLRGKRGFEEIEDVKLYYYPRDPDLDLMVEMKDLGGKIHLRHLKWSGERWAPPVKPGAKSDLKATAVDERRRTVVEEGPRPVRGRIEVDEAPPPAPRREYSVIEIDDDFFVGLSPEEAEAIAGEIRENRAGGRQFLQCPRDWKRVFHHPQVRPVEISCPQCGNTNLMYKNMSGVQAGAEKAVAVPPAAGRADLPGSSGQPVGEPSAPRVGPEPVGAAAESADHLAGRIDALIESNERLTRAVSALLQALSKSRPR